jgi:hypothetical protein
MDHSDRGGLAEGCRNELGAVAVPTGVTERFGEWSTFFFISSRQGVLHTERGLPKANDV